MDTKLTKLCHPEADRTVSPSNRAYTATRSLSGHIPSQLEALQQCLEAQRVPDPFRSVEKLHELLPYCDKFSRPSQQFQITERMASINGK
ncbi:hypothetical protein O181_037266 [Austropuccinia psidii MF-1]|uniref:Uncharacterized protein n=1 Tax=Austropuccinia psidii MF-1 TaxID=1389203 RepID=A0A9Q3D5V0_9BASI|nr:hypothetical protein [Austropuccinia psidii MF-1]